MTQRLAKGKHAPLKVTEKARWRIMAGLGWDPAFEAGLMDKVGQALGGRKTHHDLDLSCLIYDANNSFVDAVSPERTADATGKIYHSGDNLEGVGEGDDEQLSVELKDLDASIHHVVFLVKIQTGHDFSQIDSPMARLADGYSNENFLQAYIDSGVLAGSDVYLFAHIYRKGDRWQMHFLDEYIRSVDHEDWRKLVPNFLSVQ